MEKLNLVPGVDINSVHEDALYNDPPSKVPAQRPLSTEDNRRGKSGPRPAATYRANKPPSGKVRSGDTTDYALQERDRQRVRRKQGRWDNTRVFPARQVAKPAGLIGRLTATTVGRFTSKETLIDGGLKS